MDKKLFQHGAFSWFELMTSDVEAAKSFYSEIFGWQYEKFSSAPGMDYQVIKVNGEEVAGMMKIPEESEGHPPAWGTYITVDNVDETVKQVESLGGKILMPPTDIPEVGRFSVIIDPQGAIISIITYVEQ